MYNKKKCFQRTVAYHLEDFRAITISPALKGKKIIIIPILRGSKCTGAPPVIKS